MTKQRTPLSFERALVRIADVLSWAGMAAIIGKSARTVMDYSDEDVSTGICLEDAFKLEQAYRRQGGEGFPISDCWRLRLQMARGGLLDRDALVAAMIAEHKEGGEAKAAVANLLRDDADDVDRRAARRELVEHIEASTHMLALLEEGMTPGVSDEHEAPKGGR